MTGVINNRNSSVEISHAWYHILNHSETLILCIRQWQHFLSFWFLQPV